MSTPVVTESMGGRQWLAQRPKKQEVGCSYDHRRSHCGLLTVSNSFSYFIVLEAPSEIITMNRHTETPEDTQVHLQYCTNLIEKECPFSSAAISGYSINYFRTGGGYNTASTHLSLPSIFITFYGFSSKQVEATIPTQHTFHCRLFSSHSTAFRLNRGGGYNTDSTHLSLPSIFITINGFSSTSANCEC